MLALVIALGIVDAGLLIWNLRLARDNRGFRKLWLEMSHDYEDLLQAYWDLDEYIGAVEITVEHHVVGPQPKRPH